MKSSQKRNQPLRQNVKLLGSILGEVIEERAGGHVYHAVEYVRNLSKTSRRGDTRSFTRLRRLLEDLSPEEMIQVGRAFGQFLNLANVAEQQHRIRRRRIYQSKRNPKPQRGSTEETLQRLKQSGISKKKILESIEKQDIELVLTAHPTEVTRSELQRKHNRIADLLNLLDRDYLPESEKEGALRALRRNIMTIWETDEIRREKPTPQIEARSMRAVVEQTLWSSVPDFLRTLSFHMERELGQPLPISSCPFRFASWAGGDRDGNPNVTPDVTWEVSWENYLRGMKLYQGEIEKLSNELTLRKATSTITREVASTSEPYREFLKPVQDNIRKSREVARTILREHSWRDSNLPSPPIKKKEDLIDPLLKIYNSLIDLRLDTVARGKLLDTLRRVNAFGLTLTRLDLRNESSEHSAAFAAVVEANQLGNYEDWNEEKKISFLTDVLLEKQKLNLDFEMDSSIRNVLETFKVMALLESEWLGTYIISMAEKASDVLCVLALQKLYGVKPLKKVAPLFETIADLEGSLSTMTQLLEIPTYRKLVQEEMNGEQEIMLGYSDSAKDSGRFTSAWKLYLAQENLVKLFKKEKIHLTLFHGRGGTVGRGGGPTFLAINSQPPGSIENSLRITEQGEMIQSKFGLGGIALRTLEVYSSAVLEATLTPPKKPNARWRKTMNRLSDAAAKRFRSIVRENENFVPYFRTATPEPELGRLNIGSRPAKRKPQGGVESLRAIPWIFAWTQTRFMVPSWLGVGESLSSFSNVDELREMYEQWPFFQSSIDLIEMVLAKAEIKIAEIYEETLVPKDTRPLGQDLRTEFERASSAIKKITGKRQLLAANPTLRRSIDVRNPYVDPINLLQIEILRRFREGGDSADPCLLDALLISMNGIAAGMRNTG